MLVQWAKGFLIQSLIHLKRQLLSTRYTLTIKLNMDKLLEIMKYEENFSLFKYAKGAMTS